MTLGHRVLARFLERQALIAVPPRSMKNLFAIVLRKLGGVRRMKAIYEKIDRDRDDIRDYNYWTQAVDADLNDLQSAVYNCERFEESIRRYHGYSGSRIEPEYFIKTVDDFLEKRRLLALADADTRKWDAVAAECSFQPEYLALFKEFQSLVHDFTDAMRLLKAKLETLTNQAQWDENENSALPKHEKIEKLYHASIYARDLAQHGFQATRPGEGGLGLGGSVADKAGNEAISFTYDPKYALEIARWFKEVAMVYSGQIKLHQVLRWIEEEGMVREVLDGMRGLYRTCSEGGSFAVMQEGVTCLDEENGRWKFTLEKFDRTLNKVVTSPGDPDQVFETTNDVWDLYNAYLNKSKLRENPMGNMSALLKTMQARNVDPKGIGVIEAEVDMSDPDILHKPAEREFRVQPRAIKKVVRFL